MAKRSKIDTCRTIQLILDTSCHQLLTVGYQNMSYTTLSQATKISRTGISHHFPKKTDFLMALEGRFLKLLVDHLTINEGSDALELSWQKALQSKEFTAILRLVFHHSVIRSETCHFSQRLMDNFVKVITSHAGTQANKQVERLLGVSLVHIAKHDRK
ncbi:TetR/AcrR family transcriptional regulator [Vibrio sp. 10N.261.52.A1]|uniref:TetR/AcrR family transcriptional regulator n=1 Tax=Vibrio TaxID=662 RepID=UPI000C8445A0|nr:TetR/AcrR family transcriptional regulator [Vibrio sp. 10N.261.52.A1]PML78496.1 transcriptional regulator [Vibrio sp. 10N.261.52.A1]